MAATAASRAASRSPRLEPSAMTARMGVDKSWKLGGLEAWCAPAGRRRDRCAALTKALKTRRTQRRERKTEAPLCGNGERLFGNMPVARLRAFRSPFSVLRFPVLGFSEAENVCHIVEAGGAALEPLGGFEGALGEGGAGGGLVGELDALFVCGEDDGVVTDDGAAAEGVDGDLSARALADDAVAAVDGLVIEVDAAALGEGLGKAEGGAAGCVLLVAVVHLNDLGVVGVVKDLGGAADEAEKEVDAEGEVGGEAEGDLLGGVIDGGALLGGEAGGAKDVGLAVGDGVQEVGDDAGVEGEVNDGVGVRGPIGLVDEAGGGGLADVGGTGDFGDSDDVETEVFGVGQEHLAHAAGAAEDGEFHGRSFT